jgi:cell division protein FtsX
MQLPKTYNIKLEDKAAFLNKAEKLGFTVDTFDIKDDKLTDSFAITLHTPQEVEIVKSILKSSPNINDLKETIKKIIKREIQERLDT